MKSLLKLAVVPIFFISFAIQGAAPGIAPNGARDLMQAGTGSYGCTASDIAHYVARRAAGPITIDGRLDEPSWQMAQKSPRFVDMVSGAPGFYDTRAAALWDHPASSPLSATPCPAGPSSSSTSTSRDTFKSVC